MSNETPPPTRLWTPEGFREDPWRHAEDVQALTANRPVILPLALFLTIEASERDAALDRLGVLVQPGERLDPILPYLDRLALVALAFPAFSDGRSFSKAELLRSRHRFAGPIRAVGQVLVDQLPHMLRLGFTEFEVSHPLLIKRLEEGVVGGLPLYCQPTARPAVRDAKYAWRRRHDV